MKSGSVKAFFKDRTRIGWVAVVVLAVFFATIGDPTYIHLGSLVAIWALWGSSFNLIWGYAGQFSLAQVGFGAVAGYSVAILTARWGWSFWAAVPLAIALTVLFSVVVGYFSLRLSGFYFAIMTLAFALLVVRVISSSELAGRSTGIKSNFDIGTISLGPLEWNLTSRTGGFVLLAFVLLAAVLAFIGRIERSGTGWALNGLREDETLSRSLGIEPLRFRLVGFMVSAVIAAIGGILYATYLRYISPGFFGLPAVIAMIALVVLGGRGFRFGPVLGAVVYIGITQWLEVGGEWGDGVFGALLILLVLFAPKGLLGIDLRRLRRRAEPPPPTDDDEPVAARPVPRRESQGVKA
ncbi:MAG: branched-chain amino acid ABC transporter permease [Pseudonocardia sp.]|uniref:branched-chain amino acid ABC transporter permease n=1 Tax=unclassified Pseudonocardia TaxID=2619320 RepID=UPI001AC38BEA|nr:MULTISPECIES: branched-chain amino acid ABC transporter permease [unclassified Pseudonocardia]MBN9111669.1 branched-chain amino acid ABC transporter permease [Pseudonocardia sp.]